MNQKISILTKEILALAEEERTAKGHVEQAVEMG